ncbi:enoyl-CoA hydratase/isomerase family protein [Nocardia nova]|uniref:Enoyl-CoA hydratase/isomerase family protein n=2 Tax=Nocardia nova TaxID=37330 RepID=A0A2S6AWD9_9NOCA|nr:enoyl-CoA hydratase/isomerase family protein [Nocardia nova]PPJ39567.1 enoyl-CoA hydratase/isomerase family protein [Nocardia nova]
MNLLQLELGTDGSPANPVAVIPLETWETRTDEQIHHAATAIADSMRITIGVLHEAPTPRLEPLLRAATLTLSEVPSDHIAVVDCADLDDALRRLEDAVRYSPCASVALARLLRQTSISDTTSGLAAEAAVYSMLLSGKEFARWLGNRNRPRTTRRPEHPLVRMDRSDDVLSVELANPDRRNALSFQLREELLDALRMADFDPTIERVNIRGAGPVFCSGGDLDEFGTATDWVAAYLVRLERAPWRIIDRHRERFAVYAQGACIGAGIEMAAFAGRLVAEEGTVFRLPEIEMGLVPGAGGTVSIPRRIGRWRAAWMMLTGERVDCTTALRWNLIDALSPKTADAGRTS